MATLDALTGKVVYHLIGKVTTSALVRFYRKLRAAYPHVSGSCKTTGRCICIQMCYAL